MYEKPITKLHNIHQEEIIYYNRSLLASRDHDYNIIHNMNFQRTAYDKPLVNDQQSLWVLNLPIIDERS